MNKKKIGIIIGAIVAVAAIAIGVFFGTANMRAYSAAEKMLSNGKYAEAADQFTALGDYRDAAERVKEAAYQRAKALMEDEAYDEAADVFNGLGDYSDSSELATECIYQSAVAQYDDGDLEHAIETLKTIPDNEKAASLLQSYQYELAGQHYADGEYKEAEILYAEISGYEDADELAAQCAFYQTVDGQFMLAIQAGLQARWDIPDSEISSPNQYGKLIDAELNEVEPFYNETFDDKRLGEIAVAYVDVLKESADATRYYNNNAAVYETKWDAARATRLHLIEELVEDYGLTVDEKYQDTLDELINDSQVYSEQEAFEAELQKDVDAAQLTIEPYRSDYDNEILWYEYTLTITNTTDQRLEYLSLDLQVLDGNGNILTQGWATFNNVEAGQSSTVDAYIDSNDNTDYSGYTIKFVIDGYNTELYYG